MDVKKMEDKKTVDKELTWAATLGDAMRLRELLARGACPDSDNGGDEFFGHLTALACAARARSGACVKILLDAGANPDLSARPRGDPPVVLAIFNSTHSIEILRLMLDAGANPDAMPEHGQTALAIASRLGMVAATRMLINYGAQVDLKTSDGDTPAMLAALTNRFETLSLLIEAGADVFLENANGETALDHAKGEGEGQAGLGGPQCVALLEAVQLAAHVRAIKTGGVAPRL